MGILFAYFYGLVTMHFKIFPYYEIREFKQIISKDLNAKAKNNNLKKNSTKNYIINKRSFFEENVREAEIVMLGDSITDNGEWGDLFPLKDISNHGIGGETTANVLDRMDLISKTNADKIFIMLGINDILSGISKEEVFQNYQKIVNELIKNDSKVYIQSTLLVRGNNNKFNKIIVSLNSKLEGFASTNNSITYIDLNTVLSNEHYLSEEYSYDGLQLNGNGYKLWKETISPYIM